METKLSLLIFSMFVCIVQSMPTITNSTTLMQCPDSNNICQNGGDCFQDKDNSDNRFCRCTGDYYGDTCDEEAEPIYKDVLYGMILLIALLIIATVYFSCQFYVRKTDLNDAKREKMELEQHYQKELNARNRHKNNLSRQSSIKSDVSSIGPHFYEVQPNGKLRSTTVDGKEEKDHLKLDRVKFSSLRKEKEIESDCDSEVEEINKATIISTEPSETGEGDHSFLDIQHSTGERPKSWAGSNPLLEQQLRRKLSTSSDTRSVRSDTSRNSPVSQRGLTPELVRKHHAKSLQDLRVLAMNDVTAPTQNPSRKDQYVLNMHTGQIAKTQSRDEILQKAINTNQHKNKGIWAHSQERQRDR